MIMPFGRSQQGAHFGSALGTSLRNNKAGNTTVQVWANTGCVTLQSVY